MNVVAVWDQLILTILFFASYVIQGSIQTITLQFSYFYQLVPILTSQKTETEAADLWYDYNFNINTVHGQTVDGNFVPASPVHYKTWITWLIWFFVVFPTLVLLYFVYEPTINGQRFRFWLYSKITK